MAVFRRDPPLQLPRPRNPALLGVVPSSPPIDTAVLDFGARDSGYFRLMRPGMGAILGTPARPPLIKRLVTASRAEPAVVQMPDLVSLVYLAPSSFVPSVGLRRTDAQEVARVQVRTQPSSVLLAAGFIGGSAGAWSIRAWSARAWYVRAWYKGAGTGPQPFALPLQQVRWQEPWRYPQLKSAKALPYSVPDVPTAKPVVLRVAPPDGRFTSLKIAQLALKMFVPDVPPGGTSVLRTTPVAAPHQQPALSQLLATTLAASAPPPARMARFERVEFEVLLWIQPGLSSQLLATTQVTNEVTRLIRARATYRVSYSTPQDRSIDADSIDRTVH